MDKSNYTAFIDSFGEVEVLREAIENFDMVRRNGREFHVIHDNRSYRIELVDVDFQRKQYTLLVNGHSIRLALCDEYELLVHNMGLDSDAAEQVRDIAAPMPGLVLDIRCAAGDDVREGDVLLILEAMKMENALSAHSNGRVEKVLVEKGQAVEKGQVLITLE